MTESTTADRLDLDTELAITRSNRRATQLAAMARRFQRIRGELQQARHRRRGSGSR